MITVRCPVDEGVPIREHLKCEMVSNGAEQLYPVRGSLYYRVT